MLFKRDHAASTREPQEAAFVWGQRAQASSPSRRSYLLVTLATALALALLALAWLGSQRLVHRLAGPSVYAPEDAAWLLSEPAQKLVDAAYTGLDDDAAVQDYWVHALSRGQRSAGDAINRSFINSGWLSWHHPLQRLRTEVVLTAAGVTDPQHADAQYLARLLRLARALPRAHKLHLVALDQRYSTDGRPQPAVSVMAVDNDYVWSIAQDHPELIEPVVSVHPYRRDATEALAQWAERGVRAAAWMPMLQDIDPAAERLADYYQALIEHDLTLYVRTGAPSAFAQASFEYGNPMRYRDALDAGVNILMVHVSGDVQYPASQGDGQGDDQDDGQGNGHATGTELLLRLLRNPDYDDNLHVALAGVAGDERAPGSLTAWLRHPQVTAQLVYASAYPRPAVAAVVDLSALAARGFVTAGQAAALREIHKVNPLLFDFVLMRTLRLPHTDLGLPAAMFTRDQLDSTSD